MFDRSAIDHQQNDQSDNDTFDEFDQGEPITTTVQHQRRLDPTELAYQ